MKNSGPVNGCLGKGFSSVINCISEEVRAWLANNYFDKSFRTVDQCTLLKIYCILEYNYHILNRPLKIKGLFSLFIHTLHTFIVNKAFKSPLSRKTRMSISIFLSNLNPKYVEWLQSSEISVKKSAPYKSGPFTLRPQIRRLKKCCRTNFNEPFPKLPRMNLYFFISFFYTFQIIFG